MTFLVTSEKNSFLAMCKSLHQQFSIKNSANANQLNLATQWQNQLQSNWELKES